MPIIDDLRFYRGLEQNLPPLAQGQPAVTLDTNKLFVGTPNGNIEFAQQSAVSVLQKTPQEYEWTTTAGQIVYVLPSGTTYDTSSKWLTFTVGGATIEDSLIKKDSPTQFTLLVDPSVIPAGVKAVARWVMPYIPAGDNLPSQVAANTASLVDITTNQLPSKAKQVDLDATNSQVSANTNAISNIGTVNANAELVNARGTYSQLVNRLNASDASLADNTKQITDRIISAKDKQFGAVGDGVTDDTTALQSFFNYVANNKLEGKIPAGTYMISSEITIPSTYSWKVTGANGNSTTIKQKTNNTPILHFLSTPSLAHSIQIRGITFDYTSSQPSTNTNSYPIKIETMIYESIFDDLVFNNGTYAIYVPDGIQNFWGCTFDNIRFSNGLTVGAMRMSNLNAVPNNKFGRIYCHCGTMTGPAFSLKGYNFVIDNIEFLAANLGAQLMFFQAGTIVEIGAIKLEGGTYTAAQNLFEFSTSCKAHIGSINVGGTNITINPTSGNVYVVHSTGSAPSVDLTIAHVAVGGNGPFTNAYVFGSIGKTVLHTVDLQVAGWALCAISSTTGSETLIVNSFQNNHLSLDKGDANYTIAMGDPNTFTFDTVLTAPRTVNLPFDATKLFNGLKYRCIISANVATATNTITFLSSGQTYFTATTGKIIVEFTWRRKDPAHAYANWVMTDYVTLP